MRADAAGLATLGRLLGLPSPSALLEERYGEAAGALMALGARLPAALATLRAPAIVELVPMSVQVCGCAREARLQHYLCSGAASAGQRTRTRRRQA